MEVYVYVMVSGDSELHLVRIAGYHKFCTVVFAVEKPHRCVFAGTGDFSHVLCLYIADNHLLSILVHYFRLSCV